MKSNDAPQKQATPFGANGPREPITPTTPSGSNQASYDQGFPPITMTLKSAGGLPPKGQDMNQILFEQSSFNRFFATGGGYQYDATFSAAISGYPAGARIPNSTNTGFWLNTIDDNATNPENTTAALTGWVPLSDYGVTSVTGLSSSSVTLTTLQAAKDRIILSGSLTANINIVLPAWIKRWEVINNCTGAFGVTVKTPAGSGVFIPAGSSATVQGDGDKITQTIIPGTLLNVQILTASGTYPRTPGTKMLIVEMVGGGAASGGVPASSSSSNFASGGGGAGAYIRFRLDNPPNTVAFTVGGAGQPSGGTGLPGGLSSFGNYALVNGGQGASFGQASNDKLLVNGGAGGTVGATSGIMVINSQAGQRGGTALMLSGGNGSLNDGAGSPLGTGGSGSGNGAGQTGSGFGSGGGGSMTVVQAPGVGYGGAAGRPGIIIVWEYA